MQDPSDPLSRLRDIHVPVEPSLWPPAPGWWLVAGILSISLWYGFRILDRYREKRLPVRLFINRLKAISLGPDRQPEEVLYEMSSLVRQFSIQRHGRERVAALQGQDWLDFLDSTTRGSNRFSEGVGRVLGTRLYQPAPDTSPEELRAFLIGWARGKN